MAWNCGRLELAKALISDRTRFGFLSEKSCDKKTEGGRGGGGDGLGERRGKGRWDIDAALCGTNTWMNNQSDPRGVDFAI
jgi:hypothetical protein